MHNAGRGNIQSRFFCSYSSMSPVLISPGEVNVHFKNPHPTNHLLSWHCKIQVTKYFPPVVNLRPKYSSNDSIKVCHRKKCRSDWVHFIPTLAVYLLSWNVKWKVTPIYLKISLVSVATGRFPSEFKKGQAYTLNTHPVCWNLWLNGFLQS